MPLSSKYRGVSRSGIWFVSLDQSMFIHISTCIFLKLSYRSIRQDHYMLPSYSVHLVSFTYTHLQCAACLHIVHQASNSVIFSTTPIFLLDTRCCTQVAPRCASTRNMARQYWLLKYSIPYKPLPWQERREGSQIHACEPEGWPNAIKTAPIRARQGRWHRCAVGERPKMTK